MEQFSEQFGGVIARDEELPFGSNPFCDAAIAFGLATLAEFEGTTNARNDLFRYDLQLLDDSSANAVCGYHNGQFCLGLNAGLLERISEISAALIKLMYFEEGVSPQELENAGFQYLNLLDMENFEQSHMDHLLSTISPIKQHGHLDKFAFLTNILCLFVIFHEIRHAVDGHVLHLIQGREELYLGETSGSNKHDSSFVQLVCELDADADAFATIAFNLLQGRMFFDTEIDRLEAFRMFWIGTLLLTHTWAKTEDASLSPRTHPPALDRVNSLFNMPTRIAIAETELRDDIDKLYIKTAQLISNLITLDPSFIMLGVPLTEKGIDRYMSVIETISERAEVKSAKVEMAKLSFNPKTMRVMTEY